MTNHACLFCMDDTSSESLLGPFHPRSLAWRGRAVTVLLDLIKLLKHCAGADVRPEGRRKDWPSAMFDDRLGLAYWLGIPSQVLVGVVSVCQGEEAAIASEANSRFVMDAVSANSTTVSQLVEQTLSSAFRASGLQFGGAQDVVTTLFQCLSVSDTARAMAFSRDLVQKLQGQAMDSIACFLPTLTGGSVTTQASDDITARAVAAIQRDTNLPGVRADALQLLVKLARAPGTVTGADLACITPPGASGEWQEVFLAAQGLYAGDYTNEHVKPAVQTVLLRALGGVAGEARAAHVADAVGTIMEIIGALRVKGLGMDASGQKVFSLARSLVPASQETAHEVLRVLQALCASTTAGDGQPAALEEFVKVLLLCLCEASGFEYASRSHPRTLWLTTLRRDAKPLSSAWAAPRFRLSPASPRRRCVASPHEPPCVFPARAWRRWCSLQGRCG